MDLSVSSLILAAAFAAQEPPRPGDKPPEPDQPRPGMTAAAVLQRFGRPARVARQVVYRRCLEQWVYEAPLSLRIEVDSPLGQPSQVLTVRPLGPRKP